ncbi:MATE family efflux transporter [bacterium]|nr:MATE family efflux transporter [bacterium]
MTSNDPKSVENLSKAGTVSHESLEPTPGSTRELLTVAIPLILSAGSLSIMNVIDRILLTWHSSEALAAALPAGVLHWTVMSIAIGTAMYANTFVAQYDGAGKPERVVAAIWQGIYLSLIASVLLLTLIPFGNWIFEWAGHDPAVRQLEIDYFTVLSSGSLAFVLTGVLSSFYSGRRRTMVVLWVNLVSVLVNATLDYALIFGWSTFPEMGIRGAALATVIARVVAALCYITIMLWGSERSAYDFMKHRGFDKALFARLLKFGVPSGFHFFVDIAGFSVFVLLIGDIGKEELAATSLAFNLNTLAFIPLLGMGTAVMTLVGNRVGEGRPELAIKTTWTAFKLSAAWMLGFAVIYLVAPDLILSPYANRQDPEQFEAIRNQVVVLLRFVAAYCFFDAMAVVFSNAVRGAGDTKFPMLLSFLSCWLIMVLPTWIYTKHYGGSLTFSWSACTAYITFIGFGMMLRFQGGQWKSMKVIEDEIASDIAVD